MLNESLTGIQSPATASFES